MHWSSLIVLAAATVLRADDPKLVYVRQATRQQTIDATLTATGLPKLNGSWWVIGPFDNTDGRGFSTVYPPEKEIDLNKSYPGRDGQPVRWVESKQFSDGAVNSLNLFPENEYTCVYLYRELLADAPTDWTVSLGSDDTITVWLNGKLQLSRDELRAAEPDQDRVTLHLREGKNHLLMKICNYGGPCAFYFRLALPAPLEAELQNRLRIDFPNQVIDPESKYYRIDTIPIPESIVLEVGGLAFRPDGKLLACTRRGEIYLITLEPSGPSARPASSTGPKEAPGPVTASYKLFASGLHEPLGLLVDRRDVYVVQRPELSRLSDSDGDDVADEFQTICDRWGVSGDYHEFAFGPARDAKGDFYVTLNVGFGGGHQSKAPWRGWCVKVSPDGNLTPIASGLRSPNGVNFSPNGDLFFCDNQGEWVAACKMSQIRPGTFHGHPAGLRWDKKLSGLKIPQSGQHYDAIDPAIPLTLPAIWFPYGKLSQSASEPLWDTTAGRFGPFAGQCFVGDQTRSNVMRVFLEQVNGVYQGACFPFRAGFQCGVNRLAFAPDGTLYVGMTNRGWGSIGGSPYGLQRLVYLGETPLEILRMNLTKDGFELTFTKPLAADTSAISFSLESYTYNYWSTYGSPEIDRRPEAIQKATVSDDGLRVSLAVEKLAPGRVFELHVSGARARDGDALLHSEAYYTLNELVK
jgi:glucose/arabinose dehydrogenase